ncbi:MAG: nucleotidyltransferase domain-containing protein [Nanobdellota archaeon]
MKPDTKIYNAYFELNTTTLYYNQLKDHTGLSHSSLQNILQQLTNSSILKRQKTKSNTFYTIGDQRLFTLKFAEQALSHFRQLPLNIRQPLEDFLEKMPHSTFTVILFGSVAENKHRKTSDIDILIVEEQPGDYTELKRRINAVSNHPLSLFHCTVDEFIKADDHIIIQARKKGFPILGEQNFYRVILHDN